MDKQREYLHNDLRSLIDPVVGDFAKYPELVEAVNHVISSGPPYGYERVIDALEQLAKPIRTLSPLGSRPEGLIAYKAQDKLRSIEQSIAACDSQIART